MCHAKQFQGYARSRTYPSEGAASTNPAKYNKEKVEDYVQSIQRILCTIHASRPSLGGDRSVGECTTTIGIASSLSSQTLCGFLTNPRFLSLDYNVIACGRLLKHGFDLQELPSLIDAVLSSHSEGEAIRCLPVGDAQTFIDVVDEVRSMATCLHKPTH